MVAERGVWPHQEQIPEKICEQIVDVHVSQDVGQVFEAPKISSQDRNLQCTVGQILDVLLLEKAERLVEVPETVSRDRLQQRTVEETIPDTSLAEMIVVVPVIQTGEKEQQVANTLVQHDVNTVEVEKSKVITQTGQKPIIQEKINPVTKHVEVPLSQFTGKAMNIPVVAQRQIPMDQTVQKTMEIPQLQCVDEVIDVPVVLVVQAPLVQVMMKTVQIPQLPHIEKTAVISEIRTVPGPQTSESLSVDSKGLNHQDCEVLFHVNKQSPDIAVVCTSTDVLHAGNGAQTAAAAQHRSTQQRKQWQQPRKEVEEEKGREEREKGRKGQRGSGQEGRNEEEMEAEDGGEQVKKDVTDWVEVRRRTRRKSRKMVQIFVKVDGGKTSVMEMETSDKVDDIVKKIPISDQDVYVTSGGRILRRSDKLESCEVRDGSTIQVTSRMRGGGKHKDKKSQKERKREVKQEGPEQKLEEELKRDKGPVIQECDRDTVVQMIEESEENRKVMVRMLEENEDNRKMIESICDGSDVEVEQALQNCRTAGREVLGWD